MFEVTSSDSGDEECFSIESEKPSIDGVLSKWTNYIHGWQDRYVACKNGTLSYYRSRDETEFGCRGSVSLSKAAVTVQEFDACRFDVCINDSTWYLRTEDESMRQQWIDVIEANKLDPEDISLKRQGSTISLGSAPSIASATSFRKVNVLRSKLAELETFKDILDKQIETLQGYFDVCADQPNLSGTLDKMSLAGNEKNNFEGHNHVLGEPNSIGIDFKGEAITFKATTAGIQTTLSHCIELMSKREEMWQRKLEKSLEQRRIAEEQYAQSLAMAKKNIRFIGSPDFEEGPHSGLTEEEFYDAMEAELDKQDKFTQDLERSRNKLREAELLPKKTHHRFTDDIDRRVKNHLEDSMKPPGADGDLWELLAEEGEMKVFRKELVQDGLICDPLKALHSITGVTAREMCQYFWDTDVRLEWEGTIENFNIIEVLEERSIILYQTHHRVWPSARRDCLYLSSMIEIEDPPLMRDGIKPRDTWMVCNFSIEHPEAKPASGCVRALIEIALICQTHVTSPPDGGEVTRDCLRCDIVYVATVNPGGWVPAAALRTIYKREYLKFLRRFTSYVKDKTENKNILF